MPLMTDPAVIYGLELEGRWRGTIYQSDLSATLPYNTYLHAGLPPGPVANPGVQSLRAAMEPAKRIISILSPPATIPRATRCFPALSTSTTAT